MVRKGCLRKGSEKRCPRKDVREKVSEKRWWEKVAREKVKHQKRWSEKVSKGCNCNLLKPLLSTNVPVIRNGCLQPVTIRSSATSRKGCDEKVATRRLLRKGSLEPFEKVVTKRLSAPFEKVVTKRSSATFSKGCCEKVVCNLFKRSSATFSKGCYEKGCLQPFQPFP